MAEYTITAFYKFADLPDYQEWRERLLTLCTEQGVKGTILLAPEGINSTIAGSAEGIATVLGYIRSDERFADLVSKESIADHQPFLRMKVRLKKEIVALGVPWETPDQPVGTYVPPEKWNDLLSDPDVILIDTRNDYEYHLGTFKGALNPETDTFREFPDYVRENLDPNRHKKVAMFCTGGIRCEKATAYMREQGFEEVYHLQGGILKYLEEVPEEESLWEGECFVFDRRVTVDHNLQPGDYTICPSCWRPVTEEETRSPKYEEEVSCPKCFDQLSEKKLAAARERKRQIKLAETRGIPHLGASVTRPSLSKSPK